MIVPMMNGNKKTSGGRNVAAVFLCPIASGGMDIEERMETGSQPGQWPMNGLGTLRPKRAGEAKARREGEEWHERRERVPAKG